LFLQYAATRLATTTSQLHLERIDAAIALAFLRHIGTERLTAFGKRVRA
jgi:hypothetical protein